jgi:PTH1 family peptidyl-tRNA hydrolase
MPSLRWLRRHPPEPRAAKLIVGLGNPGARYAASRHNAGFQTLDALARAHRLHFARQKFHAHLADGTIGNSRVILAKPQTFMNLSGESVAKLVAFYQIPLPDLLVVYDDLDLPLGKIRLRPRGSAGGHHGMESIIARLGNRSDFPRLRVGIGRPDDREDVDHVLGNFTADEKERMHETYARAAAAIETWLREGIEKAMSAFN